MRIKPATNARQLHSYLALNGIQVDILPTLHAPNQRPHNLR